MRSRVPVTASLVGGVLVAGLAGLVGLAPAASATPPPTDAPSLAAALAREPGTVTGASYAVPGPPTANFGSSPAEVSETPLAGFPRQGTTFAILSTGIADVFRSGNGGPPSLGTDLGGTENTSHGSGARDLTTMKVDVLVPAGRNCAQVDLRFLTNEDGSNGTGFDDGFVLELDATSFTTDSSARPVISAPAAVASVTRISTGAATLAASPVSNRRQATQLLTASAPISPGAHSLYFSTLDTLDGSTDSDVVLDDLRFTSVASPVTECAKGLAPAITNSSAPAVSGTPVVGGSLSASPGQWVSAAPMTYAYQWLRAGTPITGATSSSYEPVAADLGQPLAVRVTAGNGGSSQATSAATSAVAAGKLTPGKPKVKGTPVVGQKLKASAGKWGPGKVKLKYQWYRGKKKIKHATKKTYTPAAADIGSKLNVVVSGSEAGYQPAKVASKPTKQVTR